MYFENVSLVHMNLIVFIIHRSKLLFNHAFPFLKILLTLQNNLTDNCITNVLVNT